MGTKDIYRFKDGTGSVSVIFEETSRGWLVSLENHAGLARELFLWMAPTSLDDLRALIGAWAEQLKKKIEGGG